MTYSNQLLPKNVITGVFASSSRRIWGSSSTLVAGLRVLPNAAILADFQSDPSGTSAAKLTQLRLLQAELGLTPQSERGLFLRDRRS